MPGGLLGVHFLEGDGRLGVGSDEVVSSLSFGPFIGIGRGFEVDSRVSWSVLHHYNGETSHDQPRACVSTKSVAYPWRGVAVRIGEPPCGDCHTANVEAQRRAGQPGLFLCMCVCVYMCACKCVCVGVCVYAYPYIYTLRGLSSIFNVHLICNIP